MDPKVNDYFWIPFGREWLRLRWELLSTVLFFKGGGRPSTTIRLTFNSREYFYKCIATWKWLSEDNSQLSWVDNAAFSLWRKIRPKLCELLSTQDRAMRVFHWTDHLWKIYVKIYPSRRKRRKPLKRVTDKGNRKTTYVVAWLELLWTWSIDADNCCLFRHVTCNLETRKKTTELLRHEAWIATIFCKLSFYSCHCGCI